MRIGSSQAGSWARETPIIRVFPYRNKWTPTDEWAFIGEPPLFRPGDEYTPVHISVTFTWHRAEAKRIARAWSVYYRTVHMGGPACGDPGGEFVPGRYMKEGCTITSRGCPKKCGWCVVPGREGAIRELPIQPGWIVQDNAPAHRQAVSASEQPVRVEPVVVP